MGKPPQGEEGGQRTQAPPHTRLCDAHGLPCARQQGREASGWQKQLAQGGLG